MKRFISRTARETLPESEGAVWRLLWHVSTEQQGHLLRRFMKLKSQYFKAKLGFFQIYYYFVFDYWEAFLRNTRRKRDENSQVVRTFFFCLFWKNRRKSFILSIFNCALNN